jgi:rubredoxin
VLEESRTVVADDGDFVEFAVTGSPARGAFHCSGCGYGVTVQAALPRCPMCGGTTWEPEPSSLVARRLPRLQ